MFGDWKPVMHDVLCTCAEFVGYCCSILIYDELGIKIPTRYCLVPATGSQDRLSERRGRLNVRE